jgi:Virulence-associated protein E/Domain of unknown function (DUF3854)
MQRAMRCILLSVWSTQQTKPPGLTSLGVCFSGEDLGDYALSTQPVLALVAPPCVEDPVSVKFMNERLKLSGLTPEDVGAYPISSIRYDGVGSFCIPYPSNTMWRTRHDRAVNKYLQPKQIRDVWWPPQKDPREDKQDVLYIVEGELKAARFFKQWPTLNVVGIGGAWNGIEQLPDFTRRLLPNLLSCLAPHMIVRVVYDGDIETKPNIQMAATAMRHALNAAACRMELFRPPNGKGVDDWLEQTENPSIASLVAIDFGGLEESRKQLYRVLQCQFNEDKLILNELNASKILAHFMSGTIYEDKRLGLIKDGQITTYDEVENAAISYMQGEVNAYFKVPQISRGLKLAVSEKRDLLQEMIQKLEWDGVERLNTWGSKHLKSTFPAFADEWGRLLLTGMGLRILKPGTKADHVCILVGAQGIGKSTFFEDLSKFDGHQFYYALTDIAHGAGDANRTQGLMFARSVIVDLAEGVIFEHKKIAMDRFKQMLTQTHDEYRVVYSRSVCIEPRGFVFVGTTNRRDQLGDQTGSRRYLNLEVTEIARLPYNEKLQILAEVKHKEAEIRASNWYDLNITIEQVPEAIRQENSHISNAQELINAQYHRYDAREEFLVQLLDSGDVATLKDTKEMYITAGYYAVRSGDSSFVNKGMCGRILSASSSSPTFPYRLTYHRKRIPQLVMTQAQSHGYTQDINNAQLMINGYIVTRK